MASDLPEPVDPHPDHAATDGIPLLLDHTRFVVRENGLLFLSDRPLALWTEVQVAVHAPVAGEPVHSRGVVVECSGTCRTGYAIALWLLNLPATARRQLVALSRFSVA